MALAPGGEDGEREALAGSRIRLTWAQFSAAVSSCAARLAAAGLQPGERVVLQLPNDVESVVLALALIKLGIPPVLTRPALRDHELNHLLASIRPAAVAVPVRYDGFDFLAMAQRMQSKHPSVRLLLVSDVPEATVLGSGQLDLTQLCAPTEPGVPPLVEVDRQPSDVALYVMSNGTTGLPKAVPRTHEAYAHMFRTAAQASEVTSKAGLGGDVEVGVLGLDVAHLELRVRLPRRGRDPRRGRAGGGLAPPRRGLGAGADRPGTGDALRDEPVHGAGLGCRGGLGAPRLLAPRRARRWRPAGRGDRGSADRRARVTSASGSRCGSARFFSMIFQ